MNKEFIKEGSILISDNGTIAHVFRIVKDGIRVYINNEKDFIFNNQLHHWDFANPIKDNRIVSSMTFAIRFKNFIENTQVHDCCSEEEKEYLLNVAQNLLNYQIQTASKEEEINYLKRLKLI